MKLRRWLSKEEESPEPVVRLQLRLSRMFVKPAANSICFLGEDVCESGRRVMAGMNQIDVSLYYLLLLSGKKRQNHIFSTNITSYTCFTKKGLSFEAM